MMKILSLIVFAFLLTWTWHVVHSQSPIDFETHSDIQAKMKDLIASAIKSRKPDTKSVEIINMWTTDLADKKIKANFTYKFIETNANNETTERLIDGEAVLFRDLSDNPSLDQWTVESLSTKGDSISFNDGSVVSPDNTAAGENPSTTVPQTPPDENPMAPPVDASKPSAPESSQLPEQKQ